MVDSRRNPPPGFDDLSVEDKIDYVQALWDRIGADASNVPVPPWHVAELRDRDAAYDAAPDAVTSWSEVRGRILRRARGNG